MGRCFLPLVVGLAGCVAAGPPEGLPPAVSYRAAEAPIGSAAALDAEAFAGTWHVVAEFAPEGRDCPPEVRWDVAGPGFTRSRCPGPPQPKALAGPGRFSGQGDAPIWVLWVDSGYRTAVIGTPDGRFGRILNRSAEIPRDRLVAAREILDFNGYDLEQLETVTR